MMSEQRVKIGISYTIDIGGKKVKIQTSKEVTITKEEAEKL